MTRRAAPAVSCSLPTTTSRSRTSSIAREEAPALRRAARHRLPTGIFYAQGVKANVLFFERKPGSDKPWTKKVWVYDHRTNCHYTLKTKTMTRVNLDDFVECYRPGDLYGRKPTWSEKKNPEGRWRSFTFEEIAARDKCSLDLFWLRDESLEDSASLPDPHILAQEIADDLRSALGQIEDILGDLEERALTPAERSRASRGSSGARGAGGAAASRRGRSGT